MALSIGTRGETNSEILATIVNALAFHSEILAPNSASVLLESLYSGADRRAIIEPIVNELCRRLGEPPMYPARTRDNQP
jgi:hypothetical protein